MTVQPVALTEDDARRLTERIQRIQSSRVDLVSRIASEPWKVFPNLRPRRGDVRVGAHLYLMQAGATGPVKIGRANDPHRRARELQPGCADPIAIRATPAPARRPRRQGRGALDAGHATP